MNYCVYHAKTPTFGFGKDSNFPDDFELVAIVEAENASEAFYLTNHINDSWTKNEGVIKVLNQNARSTSVGDVVVDETAFAELCMPFGWRSLGIVGDEPLTVPGNLYNERQ